MRLFTVGVLTWILSGSPAFAEGHNLTVHLHGIKNSSGQIQVELYADAKGFRKSALAQCIAKTQARDGTVSVMFSGIKPGTYAILAFHDEDNNGELNKRFGMIPTEGYALSNDPEVLGPPAFKDSAFEILSDKELNMAMHYR